MTITGTIISNSTIYGTVARLRAEHLTQVASGATNDNLLLQMLTSATAIINEALGFAFTGYASSATAKTFYRDAARMWLRLPYYESGSLTDLTWEDDTTDYMDDDDYVIESDDHTQIYSPWGWRAGRYSGTAKWGYGNAPETIVKIAMQLAVDLWNGRDARSQANVVNVEGAGSSPVQRAFTWQQWQIIQSVRRQYGHTGVA